MKEEHKEILNPVWVRINHWTHAICIVTLVITGFQLRYPDIFKIFGFKSAVHYHNVFGFIAIFNFLIWYCIYMIKGELKKQYIPTKKDIKLIPKQGYFYLVGFFKGDHPLMEPTPEAKFNPLQKTAYCGLMFFLLPVQLLTGLFLWNVHFFKPVIDFFGGVRVIDAIHIFCAYSFATFLIVHFYLATLGHTVFAHFKAMIVGYED